MRTEPRRVLRAGALALAAVLSVTGPAARGSELPHEEYVFLIAGCSDCHTREDGPALAGGRALSTPFGTFYPPNITSSDEHGIGTWSAEDLQGALWHGLSPQGAHYYPAFPYTSYTRMRAEDVAALHRYLGSVAPVEAANRDHDLPWLFGFRILNWLWKLLFFEPGRFHPEPERGEEWNRGAYLATALAHCSECHSPRNLLGATKAPYLGGNPDGPEGEFVPNITAHEEDGVGLWSPTDLVYYLRSGALPDGDYVGGAMAEVIYGGLEHLRAEDAQALVTYLRTVPAASGPE